MATASVVTEVEVDSPVERGIRMTLEEYLRTTFHPDREYVDGVAEERPVPEWDHGILQLWLGSLLMMKRFEWRIQTATEVRLQISPDRFRVTDVMVLPADREVDGYPTVAPLICIEVLSPTDTLKRLQVVVDDYCDLGVVNIWALDPKLRTAYYCDRSGFHRTDVLAVEGTPIRFTMEEIFSTLKPGKPTAS